MPTLKQGSSGPDVINLQKRLKDLGFDPGEPDGRFGPGTTAAVIAFQQSQGLSADGIVGPNTAAALQANSGGDDSSGGATNSDATGTAEASLPNVNVTAVSKMFPGVPVGRASCRERV